MDVGRLIETEIGPVMVALGFRRASGEARSRWRFAGRYFDLILDYDPRGELVLSVSSADGGHSVPLWMMFGKTDEDWAFAGSIMGNGDERFAEALRRLAGLIERHGTLLTTRDDQLLPRLREEQLQFAKQAWRDEERKAALVTAERLWTAEQYKDFVATLDPWESDLSPAKAAKLQYARRKIA